jgi:chloramphenicol 3-O-phosphotransferase
MKPTIFLISGTPGAGKSSVAHAIATQSGRGVRISVDDIRDLVVAGRADPVPTWSDECELQFAIARRNSLIMAANWHAAGFTVCIDDVVFPPNIDAVIAELGLDIQRVILQPTLTTALQRNATRTHKLFDTNVLIPVLTRLHGEFAMVRHPLWPHIDTTNQTIAESAAMVQSLIN